MKTANAIPFFLEDQSGDNVYAIDELAGFGVRTSPEKGGFHIFVKNKGYLAVLGNYRTRDEAKKKIDEIIDAMIKGECRYSLEKNRANAWKNR